MEERTRTEQNGAITDELREYVGNFYLFRYKDLRDKLTAISDRIDERHAEELERMWDEAEGADLKAFEATHVKLPVDADGVPIEIGDYLHCDETGKDFPCRGYCCSVGKDGERCWTVECSYDPYSGTSEYVSARRCRHVQPDSWERIIEDACDMASRCCDDDTGKSELVERCRRLAGEAE